MWIAGAVAATLSVVTSAVVAAPNAPRLEPASRWTYLGLGSRQVARLRVHGDFLYACTNDDLYRKELASADTLWTPLGLAGRQVHAVWAASPESLLVGLRLTESESESDTVSLYRSPDAGASWWPYQNGFGATWSSSVSDLVLLGATTRVLLGVSGGSAIEKSTDDGVHWRQVRRGNVVNVLRASPAAPGQVWAGGETAIFSPVMLRSADFGDTWRAIHLQAGGDNACDALAFHPVDPQVVYVGMEGRVMRTLNGGDAWQEVTSPNRGLYLGGMAIRSRLPLRIYAAGGNRPADSRGLVLYVSDDEGQSWSAVVQPAPLQFGVFELLLVERPSEDWLFVATDRGVYRYADVPTAVAPLTWSRAKQLFGRNASGRVQRKP